VYHPHIALLAFQLAPAADARGAYAEPLTGLAARQSRRNRSHQDANPKIDDRALNMPASLRPAGSLALGPKMYNALQIPD
jgi:hypothetical protein